MPELTEAQKAWLFELIDFVHDVAIEPGLYPDQIIETIDEFAKDEFFVAGILKAFHEMGWSAHREH